MGSAYLTLPGEQILEASALIHHLRIREKGGRERPTPSFDMAKLHNTLTRRGFGILERFWRCDSPVSNDRERHHHRVAGETNGTQDRKGSQGSVVMRPVTCFTQRLRTFAVCILTSDRRLLGMGLIQEAEEAGIAEFAAKSYGVELE